MSASQSLPDYYATLQVHPDADEEVVTAAYRQLMKKYHPDLAGDDPARVAEHAARAKAINEAFSVLRDPERRRHYDSARIFFGTYQPRPKASPPRSESWEGSTSSSAWSRSREGTAASPAGSGPQKATPSAGAEPVTDTEPLRAEVLADVWPRSPFGVVSALYYLLPGAYEWEQGQTKELITVLLLPVLITFGFALFTSRLDVWIGSTLVSKAICSALLLLLAVPLLSVLPRVALAAGPTALLLTGAAAPVLQSAHIPMLLAWLLAAVISLALSARLYVFSVLPALAACYVLSMATHSM